MLISSRIKLSLMMFLQYAFHGLWIIPLGTFLDRVGFSGSEVGSIYSTFAIAGIVSPLFVGLIADRYFAAQKILGVLNIIASLVLIVAANVATTSSGEPRFVLFYWLILLHFLCYMPTWALADTIVLSQVQDAVKDFPRIRLMGTVGWILVSLMTLFGTTINSWFGTVVSFEATNTPMLLSAAIGLTAGIFAFVLPSVPPRKQVKTVHWSDLLGVRAFGLLRDRNFMIFAATSFLIFLPGMFYWAFANLYLNESGVSYAAAWQSTGQITEFVLLISMPFFFARFDIKTNLTIAIVAWVLRFICFAIGAAQGIFSFVAIGLILHSPVFYFVTGQLYADRKAPPEMRAQIQGFMSMITYGFGWFVGSLFAGEIVRQYENVITHDWVSIWLWPTGISVLLLSFFVLFFREGSRLTEDMEIDRDLQR